MLRSGPDSFDECPPVCPLLPVDGYAFQFLQILKKIHADKKNFEPVSSQEIVALLPEYLQFCNLYEGIEVLYDHKIITVHDGNYFSISESYR